MLSTWNSCIVTHHSGQWYDRTGQYRLIPLLTQSPTIDTVSCSCTIDDMKGFVQCTIQNIFIPFSNGYTRVAIHSCMEVPFLHYDLWVIMRALWRHHQVIQARGTVVSCQVIQSGYPGAHAECVISFAFVTQLYEPLQQWNCVCDSCI